MDFSLNEEQQMLMRVARDFLEQECPEKLVREITLDDGGYSLKLWRQMAELGWLGTVFPENYGGTGGSIIDLAVLYEAMGRALLPSPHLSTVVLCGLLILATGSDKQKKKFLTRITSGDLILAFALTEPSGSWDADGISTRASANQGEYVINGTKLFVHDSGIADYLLCVARTKNSKLPEEGITLFLVDAKSNGLSQTLLKTAAGDKQYEIIFENVRVPSENILGELDSGWHPLIRVLQIGAVMLCAEMTGIGQRVLELAVDYAKTRVQFENPIGVNQYIQEHCVNLLSDVVSSKNVTYQAAWKLTVGLPADWEVAVAKAWTSDAIERACWYAHQVLAGVGYTTNDSILPLYTKRAKTAQLYLGDAAHHKKIIAAHMDGWILQRPKGRALGIWDKDQPLTSSWVK